MMKKPFFILTALLFLFGTKSPAQQLITGTGKVSISAESTLMDAKAENNQVKCKIDLAKSTLVIIIPIKKFEFEKALMQAHFNDDLHSDKVPSATFQGDVTGFSAGNLKKDGTYPVKVKGQLKLHGVTKTIETDGKYIVKNGAITAVASFKLKFLDYDIWVRPGVGNEAQVDINLTVH